MPGGAIIVDWPPRVVSASIPLAASVEVIVVTTPLSAAAGRMMRLPASTLKITIEASGAGAGAMVMS